MNRQAQTGNTIRGIIIVAFRIGACALLLPVIFSAAITEQWLSAVAFLFILAACFGGSNND